MSAKKIDYYRYWWNTKTEKAALRVYYDNTHSTTLYIETPQELSIIVDMLRNEEPVWFNTDTFTFSTAAEPVGEEEA
jgi:hypothetical protein